MDYPKTSLGRPWKRVLRSLQSSAPVHGVTHSYYAYPARFDPQFVRSVISEFSHPDDVVLDPFMGGATAVVEAVVAGRRAVGFDINPLALFLAGVKTTPLSHADEEAVRKWAFGLGTDITRSGSAFSSIDDQRLFNVPQDVARLFERAFESSEALGVRRRKEFARCLLLGWGQWLLDNRRHALDPEVMTSKLVSLAEEKLSGLKEYIDLAAQNGVAKNKLTGRRRLYCGSARDLVAGSAGRQLLLDRPKLVLTSPPYPGVHVLYHRWQVGGRKETPAPYYLAGLLDGHYASHYTMGSRTPTGLANYFAELRNTYAQLRDLLDPRAVVVQLVGFSDSASQLPLYMGAMEAAGYRPIGSSTGLKDALTTREVPNRRWYIRTGATNNAAGREFLIRHTLA